MDEVLRIWMPIFVAVVLTLYLYETGARRVYDILIAAVAIAITSPAFIIEAIVSKVKTGRVFDSENGTLKFACSNSFWSRLPALALVIVGKRNILPKKLSEYHL